MSSRHISMEDWTPTGDMAKTTGLRRHPSVGSFNLSIETRLSRSVQESMTCEAGKRNRKKDFEAANPSGLTSPYSRAALVRLA